MAPATQLYHPALGIDRRDAVRGGVDHEAVHEHEPFAPATQVVLLHLLLNSEAHPADPQALAERVGYSAMSLSRAAHALEQAGIVVRHRQGRQRPL